MLSGKHQRLEVLGLPQAGVRAHHRAGGAAVDRDHLVGQQPAEDRPVALIERLGERGIVGQLAQRSDDLEQGLGIVLIGRPGRGHQLVDLLLGHRLEEPKVQECHPPVVHEQRVARVGVAVEQSVAQGPVDVEPDQDLAPAVAIGLRAITYVGKTLALYKLRHQHPLTAHRADHVRNGDERMAPVRAGHCLVVGRLQLVVKLLRDPLADLVGDRAGIDPGGDDAQQLQGHPQVLHVGLDGLGDPRILDLHSNVAAVVERGPMDLTDRCRRYRLLVEVGERVLELLSKILLDHFPDGLERHRIGVVLEDGEDLLELRPDLLRNESQVNCRQRLPHLHCRARACRPRP